MLDVSAGNDWSLVRVWHAPIHNLGETHWPMAGFLYGGAIGAAEVAWRASGDSFARRHDHHAAHTDAGVAG
ncbi:hypothetical protein [Novosphingobium sp. PP1Y]|uniref:hypothetical protein n=1 Tax=Novosphingobium sp. PP1Y TaxID=702113 RepID=UPI0002D888D8|nr:hypothetical protein [Novosphingobium sp. PP1Y]